MSVKTIKLYDITITMTVRKDEVGTKDNLLKDIQNTISNMSHQVEGYHIKILE